MDINKRVFTLLLFAVSAILIGCTKDYSYTTGLIIENRSKHAIEISVQTNPGGNRLIPIPLRLLDGEIHSGGYSTEGSFAGYPNFLSARLKFDNNIEFVHRIEDGNAYHNFCDEKACVRSQPNKEREVFTFVFTDEDYEYAKQHADKTE